MISLYLKVSGVRSDYHLQRRQSMTTNDRGMRVIDSVSGALPPELSLLPLGEGIHKAGIHEAAGVGNPFS